MFASKANSMHKNNFKIIGINNFNNYNVILTIGTVSITITVTVMIEDCAINRKVRVSGRTHGYHQPW